MTPDRTYRNDALAARRAAREHLKSLRAARIARRNTTVPTVQSASANNFGDDDFAVAPDILFSRSTSKKKPHGSAVPAETVAPIHPAVEDSEARAANSDQKASLISETGHVEAATNPGDANQAGGQDLADATTHLELEAEAERRSAGGVADYVTETGSGDETPGPENLVINKASEEMQSVVSTAAGGIDSDLMKLPGAGNGMVWMFNQCGVMTLNDLASSDPAELSDKLGVVGRILDVAPWIEYAKEQCMGD